MYHHHTQHSHQTYKVEDAPFHVITQLLEHLEQIKTSKRTGATSLKLKYTKSLTAFFNQFTSGSIFLLFRLLLPQMDFERVYSIKEYRLSRLLIKVLSLPSTARDARSLLNWRTHNPHSSLSLELERILFERDHYTNGIGERYINGVGDHYINDIDDSQQPTSNSTQNPKSTIEKINTLLDQLSVSGAEEDSIKELISCTTPKDMKWIIRIILKDLQLPSLKTGTLFSSFHTMMPKAFQVHSDLKVLCATITRMIGAGYKGGGGGGSYSSNSSRLSPAEYQKLKKNFLTPLIGSPLAPMQCGRCQTGMKSFLEAKFKAKDYQLYVESKWDGERIQIHYERRGSGGAGAPAEATVQLFSKSGRNSTEQRKSTIPSIVQSLSLAPVSSAIMEGELVVWLEDEARIESFGTVQSVGSLDFGDGFSCGGGDDFSNNSNDYDDFTITKTTNRRHLFIILFDLMMLNGTSFLEVPLEQRRRTLERVVKERKTYVELSPLSIIVGGDWKTLEGLYTTALSRRQEGLVVKDTRSAYIPWSREHWFKVKQDYIEGFGDCIDLAVLGCKRNSSLYDEFIVGCKYSGSSVDDYVLMMSVVNGLSKDELQRINEMIAEGVLKTHGRREDLSYFVRDLPTKQKVDLYFSKPFVVEVLSSGWVNSGSGSSSNGIGDGETIWTPRHARIKRVFIGNSCDSVMTFAELQDIGRRVGGGGGASTSFKEDKNALKEEFEKRLLELEEQKKGQQELQLKQQPKVRRVIEEEEMHYYSYKGVEMSGGGVEYADLSSLLEVHDLSTKLRVVWCEDNDLPGVKCLLSLFKRKIVGTRSVEIWTKGGIREAFDHL